MALVNPGFETSDGWTLTSMATYVTSGDSGTVSPHSGTRMLQLRYGSIPMRTASCTQTVSATPGEKYTLRLWANPGTDPDLKEAPLYCYLDLGDGNWAQAVYAVRSSYSAGWTFFESEMYDVIGSYVALDIQSGQRTSAQSAFWYVDDVELEVYMGKWTAIAALQTALKTITGPGAGYNSTLSNRVYTKLITPVEEPNMTLPYICIPLDEDDERPDWSYNHVLRTYRIPFYAFVGEDMGDKWESTAAQSAANLTDDIYKVILGNPTLSGACKDIKVAAVMSQCGVLPDATFGEIKGYFEVTQAHQASDLGV